MLAAHGLYARRRDSARLILAGLFAALLAACASSSGGPAQLIGTWHLSSTSGELPEGCSTSTLTFNRDGTFDSRSGGVESRGRYATKAIKGDGYDLKLERLEFGGRENCQGVAATYMRDHQLSTVNLAFERDGHDFRLTAPDLLGAYIVYTRAD
jgi:hypothetical protein